MTPDTRALVMLNMVSGIGPRVYGKLAEALGSPTEIMSAGRKDWQAVDGVGPKIIAQVFNHRDDLERNTDQELHHAREYGIDVLTPADEGFPEQLRPMPDPPLVLYRRGDLQPEDAVALAIVGSRRPSFYGRNQAKRFGRELAARGVTIISGMARGVDARAHEGALEAGGRTVAVMGCGLRRVYPPEHEKLADRIAASGALLSELPLYREPEAHNFPRRNRIISGLALGVLVVEAADRSGSLISARWAGEQGKDVFAIPGPIDRATSRGANRLIKDGAKLVQSVEDILDELGEVGRMLSGGAPDSAQRKKALAQLPPDEAAVMRAFDNEPLHIDEVVRASGLEVARVQTAITMLEIKRLLERLPGSRFALKT